ncbi:terminase [uncultured Alistipes sp.]|uniref:terminase n=1 Tax=uncultured Alistipes sp. TaxID=538949 RepID=UPI00263AB08B|nr:terminase [uncultured Alistipes sp.]
MATTINPSDSVRTSVSEVLKENERRKAIINAPFNPVTGLGSLGKRAVFEVADFPIRKQWIPVPMLAVPMVRRLRELGSLDEFIRRELDVDPDPQTRTRVVDQFTRIRCRFDFPFWAAVFVYIKNKILDGPPEVLFRLSYPQRKFVAELENFRLSHKPIRLVLLKARQWGGSTTSQLYMAWLQLTQRYGLNSLIIAHQGAGSDEIKDMFDRMIKAYPLNMLHRLGERYPDNEPKMVGVGKSGSIFRIPQRNCKVKIGTAERPDSCRGGDYALVHLSEVGIWKETDGKKPKDIVRSACGGVLNKPGTMIVYESTANGHGNFFHKEYVDARDNPRTQFRRLFIPWYDIDWNVIPFESEEAKEEFARNLFENRNNANAPSVREEPGKYLWWLWTLGATLEGINWYVVERTKHTEHGSMAAECPSDDIEAFVNSGASVFDKYQVEKFRPACRAPRYVGDIYGDALDGEDSLNNLRFVEDKQGVLWVWSLPDPPDPSEIITGRYLAVVDVGGRSNKADWSVIVVYDRIAMMDGDKPAVVAQWRGHIDIDLLAWKAVQIAKYYDDALLVIESNTLETHDKERQVDGDQSKYILNQIKDVYDNLYARRQSEDDIRQGLPRKYGFHTNTATKPMIITSLIKYVREHAYVESDERALDEFLNYERKPNGSYGAIAGEHDDLLMTRAIGLHICFNEMPLPTFVEGENELFRRVAGRHAVSAATI